MVLVLKGAAVAALLLSHASLSHAAMKCRLKARGLIAQVPFPTSPVTPGNPPTPPGGAPVTTGENAWKPFSFNKSKIRGVNL